MVGTLEHILEYLLNNWLSGGSDSQESACNAGDLGLIPGLGRFPSRRAWQSTPVFLRENPHGQRSLMGYRPWGCKDSDMTKRLSTQHTPLNN